MDKSSLKYCPILNTNISVTNMEDTLSYIFKNIRELSGDYICVSNVHTTVMAFRDEEYRMIQNSGAMALPDGKPLSMVSQMRGFSQAERVPGPDLMPEILKRSLNRGLRHFFYGSSEETLRKLKEVLEQAYPGLQIAGMYAPPFRTVTEEEDREIIEIINKATRILSGWLWVRLSRKNGCTSIKEKWKG